MPRPRKARRICSHPKCTNFGPHGKCSDKTITMTIDEYEVIRLIDFEGFTQEQCAEQMDVARTTVQAIYATARKKIAECIVQGRTLIIDGGDIHYCEHGNHSCGSGCCKKKKRQKRFRDEEV